MFSCVGLHGELLNICIYIYIYMHTAASYMTAVVFLTSIGVSNEKAWLVDSACSAVLVSTGGS